MSGGEGECADGFGMGDGGILHPLDEGDVADVAVVVDGGRGDGEGVGVGEGHEGMIR